MRHTIAIIAASLSIIATAALAGDLSKAPEQVQEIMRQTQTQTQQSQQSAKYITAAQMQQYLARAQAGDAEAQKIVGAIYLYGSPEVPKSPKDGIAWFERAAEKDPKAVIGLGVIYRLDDFGVKNCKESIKWYKRAMDSGVKEIQAWANRDIGAMYLMGDCLDQDLDKAYQYLIRAAKMGDKKAAEIVESLDILTGNFDIFGAKSLR